MSESLKLVITRSGLDECISAKEKGLKAELKYVSAGDRAYTPNPDQRALQNELQRVEFGEYKDLGVGQLQAVAKFSGPQEYAVRELGFWLASGTLLGVISAPNTTLNYKAKDGHCIQPFTLDLSALPSETVTVIVGTENLNILIEEEFTRVAIAQVDSMHRQMQQQFKLDELQHMLLGTSEDTDHKLREATELAKTLSLQVKSLENKFSQIVADAGSVGDVQTIPIGGVLPYFGHDLPSGFLWCNGAVYDPERYPLLKAALRDNYGENKVPSTLGRRLVGFSDNNPLGFKNEYQNLYVQRESLAITNVADGMKQIVTDVRGVENPPYIVSHFIIRAE
ncbi:MULTISPECIES: phage tail protein [unclassified Pseudoalteromonas]|uniref:phage tail protein n=1 Tax=unclassified Pseudoalteromonas TaxID=194690 RepID=UPI001F330F25|nr:MULTISPECIES: tail fiber protein [unclassified Pseudoalteromonas]MCF2827067.1 tail fiber protein [Pseudoalteromonas sp. OF5H-5]MCF2832029.1 tail fiber protein [Pseudoalteromonas sp. DL2-H6]MCF2925920.1 tail fiber protein [Pseudoalteromonas sp. DL2-H1]